MGIVGQNILDKVEIKVVVEMKNVNIEILIGETLIEIGKLGRKNDTCLPNRSSRIRKVEGLRTCSHIFSTKLKGSTRC